MPIYEYECKKCGETFEFLVLGGKEPEKCPDCGGSNIVKLISSCGFFSKGTSGETIRSAASNASACGSCSASSCTTCGH